MTDLAKRMEQARGALQVDWSPERARQAERGAQRLRRRREVTRRVGTGLVAVAFLALGVGALLRAYRAPDALEFASNERVMRFDDGSIATLTDQASVTRTSNEPGRTVVEIVKGGANFKVARNPTRVFRVEAGQVAVEVLGTQFTVERLEGKAKVTVQEGRVRVLSPSGTVELGGGESGEYAETAEPEPAAEPDAPVPNARPARRPAIKAGPEDELFRAADVARMSRKPAEAVEPLRKVLRNPNSPRAPLAAFTLGRVYLEDLGKPREAAKAFGDAAKLAPGGPLAEDALAREVEAWARAGDKVRARAAAEEYLSRYPSGLRVKAVKKFGGVE